MRHFFYFYLFIFLNFLFIQQEANAQSNIKWAVNQLKSLSPAEYTILHIYDKLPDDFSVNTEMGIMSSQKMGATLQFMGEGDKTSCLSDIETDVHEVNHMITHCYPYIYCQKNNRIVTEKNMYYFYISPDFDTVLFSNVDYFPSRYLIPEIPEAIQTFRFDDYIDGNTSTQDNGLLGLLDEYNAYHHSLATAWDLKDAYFAASDDKVKGYIKWMGSLNSVAQAYYEFRFFILEYLRYAKRNEPVVYKQIKMEPGLITVFNRITVIYRNLLAEYDKEVSEGCKNYWLGQGYDAYPGEDGEFFFIGKNGSATGFQVQMEDKDKLLPFLQSHRYDEVISELNIVP
jgi:hypothetical protein